MRVRLAALLLIGLVAAAPAPVPPRAPALAPAEAAAMVALYQRLCFDAFPSPERLGPALLALDADEMKAEEVARYLHADPGRGWHLRQDGVAYVLTVEEPPFHTCALRRMTPNGLGDDRGYWRAVGAYARARGLTVRHLAKRVMALSGDAELTAHSAVLVKPGATTASETSLLLLTDYHGHLDRRKWPQSGDGPGIEIRMAHQIVKPFRVDRLR